MSALHLVTDWPVEHVAAAVVVGGHGDTYTVDTIGDAERDYSLASLTKPIVAWAVMIAVEDGSVDLDATLLHVDAPEGATMRHLLSHAGGFGFDGDQAIAPPGRNRVYSNTGFERAAQELEALTGIAFEQYLHEAVLDPLGMTSAALKGTAAHGLHCNLNDYALFVGEMVRPKLIALETWKTVTSTHFPTLAGIVPGVGRFDPCPWGIGVEIHGAKFPHWMGSSNSPMAFGHFGGSGTMTWVEPSIEAGVVALTDRPFDQWRDDAMQLWPAFSDAVVNERRRAA
jgi:CubicO group peptidase (beta-lactamase class C family)